MGIMGIFTGMIVQVFAVIRFFNTKIDDVSDKLDRRISALDDELAKKNARQHERMDVAFKEIELSHRDCGEKYAQLGVQVARSEAHLANAITQLSDLNSKLHGQIPDRLKNGGD
jgi:hypothetical protein